MLTSSRPIRSRSTLRQAVHLSLCGTAIAGLPAFTNAASDETLESVIITASKIQTTSLNDAATSGSRLGISALDLPATLSAISGEAIELRGDTNMVDAVSHSPGLAATANSGSGGYGFAVRGFGSSSVTILYDGTKSLINTGSMTYPYDTWNVERIEVLNGPASVLYGGGAIGAAINVIPRKPSADASTTTRLAAGSFDTYRAALDSTGPITDQLLYRLDVSRYASDGYVQRGDSSGTVVTGALKYLATDDLSFTLSADYADRDQWNYSGMPLINGRPDESLRRINYDTYDSAIPFEDRRITLLTEWQPSESLKIQNSAYYLHGYRLWRYPTQFVYRAATNDILRRSFGTFLQYQNQLGDHAEAVLNHTLFGMANTFSVGFDVAKLQNKRFVDTYTGTDIIDIRNSSPGYFPASATTQNYQETRDTQYSVFAEDRLVVLPSLSLIGGLRYDHADVDRDDLVKKTTVNKVYDPVSWRVGAVYEIVPKFNVYAQYSTAVDPVSNLCCISASQLSFDMSEGKQTEIGVKNVLLDGRVEWTLSGYRITKNKLLTPDPNNAALSLQVGQQSSRGIEGSLAIQVTDDVRVEVNGTTLEARYDDFYETVSGVRVSRVGNRPTNIPQQLANAWITWNVLPTLQLQTGVEYRGDMFVNTDNSRKIPSYTLVDAGARWAINESLFVDGRVANVFDKFYAATSQTDGSNGAQWVLGPPRSYEVSLTAKF